jgi:tripeptide aminopeptidase
MNLERWLQNTMELQRIPAPTFHETERGEFMHNAFRANGLRPVELDVAGNVYAQCSSGDGPPLVVSAHLDTVFPVTPDQPAEIRDDRLYGPGVGDNAVALGSLLELAVDLQHDDGGNVWLVANVAEEGLGNLLGMQHVVERFGSAVAGYVVLEGMALGHIYHRGLPVRRFRLRAETDGGHAWIHAGRPSAVHVLVQLAVDLLQIPLPQEPRTSLNIGRIEGGTTVNTIADSAEMELDLRSVDEGVVDDMVGAIERCVAGRQGDSRRVSMEAIGHRPGGEISPDHPLVQAAIAAHHRAGLGPPVLGIGSTDANLPLSLGLPAVCVGLTRGGGAHSASEFIEIEPLASGYAAVLDLIRLQSGQDVGTGG